MLARINALPPVLPSVPEGPAKSRNSVRGVLSTSSRSGDGFRQVRKDRLRLSNQVHSYSVPIINNNRERRSARESCKEQSRSSYCPH